MQTAIAAPFHDDVTWDDCLEWIDWRSQQQDHFLWRMHTLNERIGQAWFNSLRPEDAQKLVGTLVDPFHKDTKEDVQRALAYLLEN
jgi:hypothetical protein